MVKEKQVDVFQVKKKAVPVNSASADNYSVFLFAKRDSLFFVQNIVYPVYHLALCAGN